MGHCSCILFIIEEFKMAIDPSTEYPGKITAPDANYDYGSAKSVTTPTGQDGTPWSIKLVNDLFGFQQALLKVTGIVPSGNAETQLASQYLSALSEMITTQDFGADAINTDTYEVTTKSRATKYEEGLYFLQVTNTNTGAATVDYNTLGAKAIKRQDGSPLQANDLTADVLVPLIYDGTNMVLFQPEPVSIRDISRNLVIKNGSNPDEQVDIDADELTLQSILGVSKRLTGVNFTAANVGGNGENKLFTGSVAADTWYAIWITEGISGSTSGLHPSSNLTTVLGDAPAGFKTYGALVGWILTDASSDFLVMYQRGNRARCATGNFGTTSTTAAQTDISAFVPPDTKLVNFTMGTNNNAGVGYMHPVTFTPAEGASWFESGSLVTTNAAQGDCPVETQQEVYVASNNGAYTQTFNVQGWEL